MELWFLHLQLQTHQELWHFVNCLSLVWQGINFTIIESNKEGWYNLHKHAYPTLYHGLQAHEKW